MKTWKSFVVASALLVSTSAFADSQIMGSGARADDGPLLGSGGYTQGSSGQTMGSGGYTDSGQVVGSGNLVSSEDGSGMMGGGGRAEDSGQVVGSGGRTEDDGQILGSGNIIAQFLLELFYN